ncbi:hypothetical protein [Reichenbachiella sp.]|uniref:hypothetical protein n=1 Tax=Reichenbachiella sp. TaxID=2184521 RepID=UPI003BB16963
MQISIKSARALQEQEALVALEVAKNESKQVLTCLLIGGILLLALLLFVLYNRFRVMTEQKKIIENQKVMVDANNQALVEKNRTIQAQADQIAEINEKIKLINESLETRVEERTEEIETQNKKLRYYAFSNSRTSSFVQTDGFNQSLE